MRWEVSDAFAGPSAAIDSMGRATADDPRQLRGCGSASSGAVALRTNSDKNARSRSIHGGSANGKRRFSVRGGGVGTARPHHTSFDGAVSQEVGVRPRGEVDRESNAGAFGVGLGLDLWALEPRASAESFKRAHPRGDAILATWRACGGFHSAREGGVPHAFRWGQRARPHTLDDAGAFRCGADIPEPPAAVTPAASRQIQTQFWRQRGCTSIVASRPPRPATAAHGATVLPLLPDAGEAVAGGVAAGVWTRRAIESAEGCKNSWRVGCPLKAFAARHQLAQRIVRSTNRRCRGQCQCHARGRGQYFLRESDAQPRWRVSGGDEDVF
mmetsp:Transcript_17467/g.47795  ORF Transcript_17467/g.47795 Transcript_17467/m.47795 type:complete len:327 (-) Transcript_17467:98-1078(-)